MGNEIWQIHVLVIGQKFHFFNRSPISGNPNYFRIPDLHTVIITLCALEMGLPTTKMKQKDHFTIYTFAALLVLIGLFQKRWPTKKVYFPLKIKMFNTINWGLVTFFTEQKHFYSYVNQLYPVSCSDSYQFGIKQACFSGCAQILHEATPPIGNIHLFSWIAITCQPMQ